MKKPKISGTVPTQTAAAKRLDVTTKTLRNWRTEGCPGFNPDGSVNLLEVEKWLNVRNRERRGPADLKEEEALERIRKLRLANDRFEARLVERAWVIERFHRYGGLLEAIRLKSEAEHPLRFAAAVGDVTACRVVVQGMWDEIKRALADGMGEAFDEATKGPNE